MYICECSCHIDVIGSPRAAFIEPLNMAMGWNFGSLQKQYTLFIAVPSLQTLSISLKKYTFFVKDNYPG